MSQQESAAGPSFTVALISGGFAGTSVDVALFPIDTLKTRLQSPQGFAKAGGFIGIYNGIGAAAAGSAPGAALFFATYESMKPIVLQFLSERSGLENPEPVSHMISASMGECAACLVRVPTEVVKAKMQTAKEKISLKDTFRAVLQERHGGSWLSGFTGGLYRGFGVTLFREIPFAMIQFPLYERFKVNWSERQGRNVSPVQAAACGSASGAIAAAITTPLDVIKTRLMLGVDKDGRPYLGAKDVLKRTLESEGKSALFNGLQPRVMWTSIGGFVFFGAYEGLKSVISPLL
jgi:solute carrier family 25 S-adenosylmethionine transporter 26